MTTTEAIYYSVEKVYNTKLDSEQKANIYYIFNAFVSLGAYDVRKFSYILATSWNETRFRNIMEFGGNAKSYAPFWGRGLSQLTHEGNYKKFSLFAGVDLYANPDVLLDNPELSARILCAGMLWGGFTGNTLVDGLKLSDFINNDRSDYIGARQIVNGHDKDVMIGNNAKNLCDELIKNGVDDSDFMLIPMNNERKILSNPKTMLAVSVVVFLLIVYIFYKL